MTDKEALRKFEEQLQSTQAVLDSGFGMRSGENNGLYRRRKEMAVCAISALRERIERNNGWISVADRLPEKDGRYLVIKDLLGTPYHSVLYSVLSFCIDGEKVDKYDLRGKHRIFYDYDSEYGYVRCGNVTHWMPLPAPPKECE